jgi:hypothetical protein
MTLVVVADERVCAALAAEAHHVARRAALQEECGDRLQSARVFGERAVVRDERDV